MSQDILIRSAKVIDPTSGHHLKKIDILVRKGKIAKIGKDISARSVEEVKYKGLHVSPGWVDLKANFRDPGYEFKEDINSGLQAAARGGFSAVLVMPSTLPVIDGRSGVEYLLKRANGSPVQVLPCGAISKDLKGEQLAELYDMHQSGAVAFSDDKEPVRNSLLMLTALLYTRNFNGRIFSFAHDANIAGNGVVHEGDKSTSLGLKGIPALAEKLHLERDLSLVDYTNSSCHFSTISTAEAVEAIASAKRKKLCISADVAAHHLLLSEADLEGFESNYKVLPPLRDKKHIKALIKGLKNGSIDAICSDHQPEDIEHKEQEFGVAEFGMIGLQTAFAVANTALKHELDTTAVVDKFAAGPRRVLGLSPGSISLGEPAELTLFDPALKWTLQSEDIVSKSRNTPFIGCELTGKALGVINGDKAWLQR